MTEESNRTEIHYLFKRKPGLSERKSRFDVQRETYNSINNVDTSNLKDSNIYIYVHKKKLNGRKRTQYNVYQYSKKEIIFLINSKQKTTLQKHNSLLELEDRNLRNKCLKQVRSSTILQANHNKPYHRNFIVNNCCKTCDKPECSNPFANPAVMARIYRCQMAEEDTCCCSCNSDAMFEVMKSLYDCYKKKNCENCRCILCGYGKAKKTVAVGEDEGEAAAVETLEGKSPKEKEKFLRDLAMKKKPLPEGNTQSEKNLIAKVKRDLGLPTEPTNSTERAKLQKAYKNGIVSPLEGKSPKEKEDVLRGLLKAGVPLPEGRTPSDKDLIARVKASRKPSEVSSEKFKQALAEGLTTPLRGKTPEQKEKILKGLAKHGIPLPDGDTPSEKQLIDKAKRELGLPIGKTASEKKKLKKASAGGIITPLEGKSPEEKENILTKMVEAGVPLPEGRTPSEKALIDKVQATTVKLPSAVAAAKREKIQKAKDAGLITPLEGKTPEQKEKILKGLAKHGIPLPDGKTPSEKKLIDKVRQELGLPPTPKTSDEKKYIQKGYEKGIITPLEGKTPEQKENVLRKMMEAGIPLPEGRTLSEKALIDKVQATTAKKPSGIPSGVPVEKIKKAKAEGFITPLAGKTPEQKEKILKGLAKNGIPLPEGKTDSEKALIAKVKKDLGLPPQPKSSAEKAKSKQAYAQGLITPLEGKTPEQKENVLRKMMEAGIPLPEGRTPTEKSLIDKVKATAAKTPSGIPSGVPVEKVKKAKAEGFITPLAGKTPEQKEKILKGLAKNGIPLPEGKTDSEKALIAKVKKDLGLPPQPKSSSEKAKLKQAYAQGLITPLEGKTPEQKEKILKGLAKQGIPLPEGKTPSEKKLIDKVRQELGLPPTPKSSDEEKKLQKGYEKGIITPLEGKTPEQKENVLRKMIEAGIPLPEGRTPTEKALIDKVKATAVKTPSGIPSGVPVEKIKKAKAEGFITPLAGKTPEQKEKILKGLANNGIPLPEGKTDSEKALIAKVKKDLGLPPQPKSSAEKAKLKQAYAQGLITPLEGKTPEQKENVLRKMMEAGIPLPEGRTPTEKSLIDKVKATAAKTPSGIPSGVPVEKAKKAKAEGFITPLAGKTPEQKEKILKGLAKNGIPLPEGKTDSEKALIAKVKKDLGLPPQPKSSAEKAKLKQAYAQGLITPLEGKTPEQKENVLRKMMEAGIPLPEGRTPTEKSLIDKVKATAAKTPSGIPSGVPVEKVKKAKAEGFITPLAGKTPEQKEKILKGLATNGIPLPEGKTDSEKALIAKVKKDLGLPPQPKSSAGKAKLKQAYAQGLITPLEGKTPEQKEKILRGLANQGIPLPEGKTPSEKKLIDKVRQELGLPPTPKSSDEEKKLQKGYEKGIITPLEGKTPEQKENVLRKMMEAGIPLPEGRTLSEKTLIDKVQATTAKKPSGIPSGVPVEKIKKAKAEGFITPLAGKTPEQKERILKGLANNGIPLPEGKTDSEKALIAKIKKDLGLPPQPKSSAEKAKLKQAYAQGLITPLEGKTPEQKENVLRKMMEAGIPLPEGRTPTEKLLIDKVKATAAKTPSGIPSGVPVEKVKKAKAEGFITPLAGKTPEQKERILKGLATNGIPLPEGKTDSEKALIAKVKKDLGLPPQPKSSAEKAKLKQAYAQGLITPLEGKTPEQKENVLRKMMEAGIPLPEGRTPTEKSLIDKVKAKAAKTPSGIPSGVPVEKVKKAKAEGFITPLTGKTPEQKEKILKGLAKNGIPLPEGKTDSEKALIAKVKKDLGLPPQPKSSAEKAKLKQAYAQGLITPLEGKTPEQKENVLRKMMEAGIPLPEGRTPTEKSLIDKVKATAAKTPSGIPSGVPVEKVKKAKAEGFITPLAGKTPEQKEKILKGLAKNGIPLPEGKTDSEKALIAKVKKDLGLPPQPKSSAEKAKLKQAYAQGLITPLEGKTPEQKENVLRKMMEAGIPLPEGRTPTEKSLIDKVKATAAKTPSGIPSGVPVEKIKKAKAEGFITPLAGKTPEQKERILKGLARNGIPLPEGKTDSEKALIAKVKKDLGLPPQPKSSAEKAKFKHAYAEGLITPLEGKTPEQKEKILRGLANQGIPLPEGKTPSEKKLIDKVRQELGLPPTPKSSDEEKKLQKGYEKGIITPLEGKTPEQKENVLRKMMEAGIPLPEGRTLSEKALIDKVQATTAKKPSGIPSGVPVEKIKKAKAEGFITPLAGKTPEQKERILKGLANNGIPLPEGKTDSEKALIAKVKKDLGLPPQPKNSAEKAKLKYAYAQGLITPLEGKTPSQKENVLRKMRDAGIQLPEGRSPSEQALVNKIRAERPKEGRPDLLRKAKEAGLLTPLEGKTPEQKEKILKGLAKLGLPLPEGKTPSDIKLIENVRKDMGLPPEPKTPSEKVKMAKLYSQGIITPLEGKTPEEKEKALRKMKEAGISLPEGRTPSEKALIDKVKTTTEKKPSGVASGISPEVLKKAKAEGLLTPLKGKTPEQKEKILRGLALNGIPLPRGTSDSEKKLIDKVRLDVGLPPAPKSSDKRKKLKKAYNDGIVTPLEGKTPEEKEKAILKMFEAGIPLPEGRTPSEKALIDKVKGTAVKIPSGVPSEKLKKAKAEGLLTPLKGKTPEEKEKILRALALNGIPLPEGESDSERKLIDKVRLDVGLPPTPKSSDKRKKLNKGFADGIVTPLEGKTPEQKEKALRKMFEAGIPLPEGRTPSEKALIDKVKGAAVKMPSGVPSEKLKKAKAQGLLTPLKGKTPEQKEKILRALALNGIPLPEGESDSERKLIDKVKLDVGLPPTPKSSSKRKKLKNAYNDGIITPLEGKTPDQKEKVLRKMFEAGIPLPEGRTPSEKALIDKVKSTAVRIPSGVPPEALKKAKAEGLLTPLKGKTPEHKEKILRGLALNGIPLPEGTTDSEKELVDKVKRDLGLPPSPKSSDERKKLKKGYGDGIVTPLEGKSLEQKEKALQKMIEAGIPLPQGRTPSEKALIDKVKGTAVKIPSGVPPEALEKAKAEGFLTPLKGKTPEQKEKILRGLALNGIPLPEGTTDSEKKLVDKVKRDLGLPPTPKSSDERKKLKKGYGDGIVTPLEGKTPEQKEKALQKMFEAGIPLPEGRTSSEKALIDKIKATTVKKPSRAKLPLAEKIKQAQEIGLITPIEGKTPEQKKKILQGLAKNGIPFPEGKTASDKKLIDEVRKEMGLAPLAKTPSEKALMDKAYADGIITPLEGKTPEEKEKALEKMLLAGVPLPEGRTDSEKALIEKTKGKVLKTASKAKERGVHAKAKGIASEKLEEIKKTTKCDRACGCDRKKIRFKHSYVKIRVTSPDISSFCDCPDECIPGVKGGVFVDNDGIKITVGFSSVPLQYQSKESCTSTRDTLDLTASRKNLSFYSAAMGYISDGLTDISINKTPINYSHIGKKKNSCQKNNLHKERDQYNNRYFSHVFDNSYLENTNLEDNMLTDFSSIYMISSKVTNNTDLLESSEFSCESFNSSIDSILLLKTESSLSLTQLGSNSTELASISVISVNSSMISELSNSDFDLVAESEIRNIVNLKNYSTESLQSHNDEFNRRFFYNDDVTILRFAKNKKKTKDKKKGKKVLINEPTSENIMKIVAEEILNQTPKSDSSSVFVVVQSENDTNTDVSSAPSQSISKDNSEYKSHESYPIVTSDHQLLIASRGVKLMSMPKDMKELILVKRKKSKANPRKSHKCSSKSDNEVENKKNEIKRYKKNEGHANIKISHQTNEVAIKKVEIPYSEVRNVCSYHKNKISEQSYRQNREVINLEAKQQLGFGLNLPSGDKCVYRNFSKVSKPASKNKIIETTSSLTSMCQKGTEIVPEGRPMGLDTTCDRPCTCEVKSEVGSTSSPVLSQIYDKSKAEFSGEAFIRKSIPYLYRACQYISPHSSPSDTEPCRCDPKPKSGESIQKIANVQEYTMPVAEIWIDYGKEQRYNYAPQYTSPSDMVPCGCSPISHQYSEQRQHQAETIAHVSQGEIKESLKQIQQSFHQRFRELAQNEKRADTTSEMKNEFSSPIAYIQDINTVFNSNDTKRLNSEAKYFQTNNQYLAHAAKFEPNTAKVAGGNYTNQESELPKTNHEIQTATVYENAGHYTKMLPNTDFHGQCPEIKHIMQQQYANGMYQKMDRNTDIIYANYTSKGPELAKINNDCRSKKIFAKQHQSNYCGQCPESMIYPPRTYRDNREQENLNNHEDSSHPYNVYRDKGSVCLSRALVTREPQHMPLAPPPTRRNTFIEEMDAQNAFLLKTNAVDKGDCRNRQKPCQKEKGYDVKMSPTECCKRAEAPTRAKTCNECCVRGKIVDCLSPGKPCDPCERFSSFLPVGFKLSNTCHSKNHMRDLIIYDEDSSHECCCLYGNNNASRGTVEEIRDAVLRFMKAKELGVVCQSKTVNKNICDQTRELFQGMDQIIAERENCSKPPTNPCGYTPTDHNDNCSCPKPEFEFDPCGCNASSPKHQDIGTADEHIPVMPLVPFLDVHHIGLREKSLQRKFAPPKDPQSCVCRASKNGKPPLDHCVCPKYECCKCCSATEEQWMEYFSRGAPMTARDAIKLQTEMTHTTSGFKFMKRQRHCNEINTYEEALEFYALHEGLKSGANADGTCPGCGDTNCPGLKEPDFFNPQNFDPEKLIAQNYERYAKINDIKCGSTCADYSCPGLGPYGLLPPIPGGPLTDVKVTEPAERGPHRACSCEPKEDFENAIYCPPAGPVYCECAGAKTSSTSCECWPDGPPGEGKEVKFLQAQLGAVGKEERNLNDLKVRDWDKGPCAPVGGFKVCLGGKGTASTGLKGICCFNAFESRSQTSVKSASSEYIVYL